MNVLIILSAIYLVVMLLGLFLPPLIPSWFKAVQYTRDHREFPFWGAVFLWPIVCFFVIIGAAGFVIWSLAEGIDEIYQPLAHRIRYRSTPQERDLKRRQKFANKYL